MKGNWRPLALACLVAFVALFLKVDGANDAEFLRQLNSATVQLLGFTGIVLGIGYAAYHESLKALESRSRGWFDFSQSPNLPLPLKEQASKAQNLLAEKANIMPTEFNRCFKAFFVSASAFAFLTIVALVHLRSGVYQCLCYELFDMQAVFTEFFLLVLGIVMLLIGLFGLSNAALWEMKEPPK